MKIIAGEVKQRLDVDSGLMVQDVPWAIWGVSDGADGMPAGDRLLNEGIQAFPLQADEEDVRSFLKRTLDVWQEDSARYEASKELQANIDNASEVGGKITGVEITSEI